MLMCADESFDMIFKIIVVGDAAVGKTALAIRYSQNRFQEDYLLTLGVNFLSRLVIMNCTRIKLQIWDTGGQELFRQLRSYYFKGANGGLLCYSITDRRSFSNMLNWYETVKRNCGNIPLILVATKNDLQQQRIVNSEEGKELAKLLNIPFYETSSKTGENVELVFTVLAKQIYEIQLAKKKEKSK